MNKRSLQFGSTRIWVPIYDVIASGASFFLAVNFSISQQLAFQHAPKLSESLVSTAIFASLATVFILSSRMHRSIWAYSSLSDFLTILRVSSFTTLAFLPVLFLVTRAENLPRSTPVLAWVLMVSLLSAPRLAQRIWTDSTAIRGLLKLRKVETRADAVERHHSYRRS